MKGTTLVELLVVLVLLGLLTGFATLSVVALKPTAEATRLDSLRAARAQSIRSGSPVVIQVDSTRVRFLPDGQVLGGSVDQFTGVQHEP